MPHRSLSGVFRFALRSTAAAGSSAIVAGSASGHHAAATIFDERSRQANPDVRALHDVIVTGRTREPMVSEGA